MSTIERIQKELTSDSHVYRYNPELAADDGFGGQEGTFSLCSFWLVEALARAGRLEEARLVLEKRQRLAWDATLPLTAALARKS